MKFSTRDVLILVLFISEFATLVSSSSIPGEVPSNLFVAVNSSSSLRVSWSHINNDLWNDNSSDVGYGIRYRINGSEHYRVVNVSKDINQYIVGGLIPLSVYEVSINAKNIIGVTEDTPSAFQKTPAGPPISPPVNLTAYNTSASSINITWYDIQPIEWGGSRWMFLIEVETLDTIFLLYPNETDIVNSSLPLFNSSAYNNTINQTDQGPLENEQPKMFYFNVSRLDPYREYKVKVACVNIYGNGPFSESVAVMTEEEPPDFAPTDIQLALITNDTILVKWKKPKLDDLKGNFTALDIFIEAVYDVTDLLITTRQYLNLREKREINSEYITQGLVMGRQTFTITNPTKTEYNISNLMGNTNYKVNLALRNKFLGVLSEPAVTIKTAPKTPMVSAFNVSCESYSPTSLIVKWRHSPPAYLQGERSQYKVYYEENLVKFSQVLEPDRTSLFLVRLVEYKNYTIWITSSTEAGEGNPTEKLTCETLPGKTKIPPSNFTVETLYSPNKTLLTWKKIPWYDWPGTTHGYTVSYRKLWTGEEQLFDTKWVDIHLGDVSSFEMGNIDLYTTFEVKVAGRTNGGVGKYSETLQFETCHVPSPEIKFHFKTLLPYIGFNADVDKTNGIFSYIIPNALLHVAKQCKEFGRNISIEYIHEDPINFYNTYANGIENDMVTAPYLDHIKPTSFFVVIDIMENKGFTLVSQQKTLKDKLKENEKFLLKGLKAAAPLFFFAILMHFPFGAIFWFLEPRNVDYKNRGLSFFGILEGIYLALQVSTTVGYGDKIPKTILGRIYNMLWALIVISVVGMVVGNLSSILITAAISNEEFPNESIAAVKDTAEFVYGMKHLSQFDKNASYLDYRELLDAMNNQTIKHALFDSNVAAVNRYEIFKNKLEMKQVTDMKVKYGFALFGQHQVLRKPLEDYVSNMISVITVKKNDIDKEAMEQLISLKVRKPEKLDIISGSSPLFQYILITLASVLFVAMVIGTFHELYQSAKRKREQRKIKTISDIKTKEKENLIKFSNDFLNSLSNFTNKMKKKSDSLLLKHAKELITLQEEVSELYEINFKHIKSYELNISMNELVQFSDEIKARKPPSLKAKGRMRAKAVGIRLNSCCYSMRRVFVGIFNAIKSFFQALLDFFC